MFLQLNYNNWRTKNKQRKLQKNGYPTGWKHRLFKASVQVQSNEDFSVQGVDYSPHYRPNSLGHRMASDPGEWPAWERPEGEVKGQGKWDRSAPPGWGQVSGTWRDGRGLHRVR